MDEKAAPAVATATPPPAPNPPPPNPPSVHDQLAAIQARLSARHIEMVDRVHALHTSVQEIVAMLLAAAGPPPTPKE